jgi:hypothetical protein
MYAEEPFELVEAGAANRALCGRNDSDAGRGQQKAPRRITFIGCAR